MPLTAWARRVTLLFAAIAVSVGSALAAERSETPPVGEPAHARNVILFIGDGMGVSTVTAARIYDGQSRGRTGEENLLSFERFPNLALVKTYNSNQQVPDSAGTATAINTGVKTRAGAVGVGPGARIGDCSAGLSNRLPNIAERLQARGLAIGIITTTRITHATPAAVYAHSPDRNWENDSLIPVGERGKGCADIATQLVSFPFSVAMGGGRQEFFGQREAGRRLDPEDDLISSWKRLRLGHYVSTRGQLRALPDDGAPLLGLFANSHMTFMLDRSTEHPEPTLSEMTATAIDRLSKDSEGYFLVVEGGRIDHGHHNGQAAYALAETQEFARAVEVAVSKIDLSETLILVTADHSHVFSIAGYPTRGNPILGLAMGNDDHGDPTGTPITALDGQPYTTLGYQNGPGALTSWPRPAPASDPKAAQQALIPTSDSLSGFPTSNETHGGEDVPLYAAGAASSAVRGVIEQNLIYNLMIDALGREQ